jgi:soluble lytic murein transglycosylase-like protein
MSKSILPVLGLIVISLTACLESKAPERVIVEVPAKPREFKHYLREAAKAYGVPETIAAAMVVQESGWRMEAIRFEPGQIERAKRVSKASGEQLRMYASSHCALQVMGWHTPPLGLKWNDLYDPQTCAEVGMKIMSDCLRRSKDKSPLERVFNGLTCYNGSESYARSVLNKIGAGLLNSHLSKELGGA